ncbi:MULTISPECIES: glycosyltransferase family 2 protein [unclassified Treponema]|uniref:glycosyltransferase family 2 protein n=1 Tax=unclassified Treponema TaxID=2638727 RepID=UPI0020A47CF0|nr:MULTISPECIES: glycosyltransferase family 2 protein [unclassified Treponema]UTC68205.1 glycosyltransferase family 2 protein [Treponema sp. OMZ 789]UTC70925.1 glycosyltransferase family 2 protein [Treponema sp. OMZ 790]UTC73665.1 glycosyltransferase family 2 protein [Treponema sp. OMZ 791]
MHNKLTILMPSYNRGQYIMQAVDSALSQKTDFGFKLIITDDCSTDNSVAIIKELQKRHPDTIEILLSAKNEKLLANILKAQVKVKTEYFCVLDPDDYYTDEYFLQKAVDFLDTHKDFSIYSSNCQMLYEDNTSTPFIKNKLPEAFFTFDDLLQNKVIITQTAGSIFRNVVYNNGIPEIIQKAVGTQSESSFRADTERYIFHLHKGKAYFKNEIVAVYRIHNAGIWTSAGQFKRNLLSAQAYYDYFRYFDYTYPEYFIKTSMHAVKECFEELKATIDTNTFTKTINIEDIKQLIDLMTENEKYYDKSFFANDISKTVKNNITIKKIIKYALPYGLVRFIQLKRG